MILMTDETRSLNLRMCGSPFTKYYGMRRRVLTTAGTVPAVLAIMNVNSLGASLDKYTVRRSHNAHIFKLLSPAMREAPLLSSSAEL